MDLLYKKIIRPLLFRIAPETIHNILITILKIPLVARIIGLLFRKTSPDLETLFCGLRFRNPVGLAAGFDKNAELIHVWDLLGFGFAEIGTVTPRPQKGNPKPRLFRLPRDKALINRMGFNNNGLDAIAKRIKQKNKKIIIGGNIGKNKSTPNEKAIEDYEKCFLGLYDVVDYFVVNVSSPNTPNLRELQEKEPLKKLLIHLSNLREGKVIKKPIFLKIAPDLNSGQVDDIIEIVKKAGVDGLITTNTTVSREGLETQLARIEKIGDGGLSGKPLRQKSTDIISYISKKSRNTIPIIGVGGIHSPEDALEKLQTGAGLVQLYTGFVYEGPGIITKIIKFLKDTPYGQNKAGTP